MVAARHRAVALLFAALGLDGCIPVNWPATPAIEARVIDATTERPIAGALVTVWATEHADRRVAGKTDAQGRVSLARLDHTMWLPPLPIDPAWPESRIHWEAAGYAPQEQDTLSVLFDGTEAAEPRPLPVTLPLTPAP